MYPTLFHAFKDLFGLELSFLKLINSFGFFVAVAFMVGYFVWQKELVRKEALGHFTTRKLKRMVGEKTKPLEYITNGLLGFLLGYKALGMFIERAEVFAAGSTPQTYLLSTKGSWIGGIVLAGLFVFLRWREAKKTELPEPREEEYTEHAFNHLGTLTTIAAVGGIAGAKLFHLFENPAQFVQFFKNPSVESFMSGLTIYGGLIVGGGSVLWYAKRKGISAIHLCDAAAPAMILAYGVGRIGCQVAGDGDWGVPNTAPKPGWMGFLPDWMWSYKYPNNVNVSGKCDVAEHPFVGYGKELCEGVWPTPFYETLMAIIIFAILWKLRKKITVPFQLFAFYLLFNGIERFLIELIRVNVKIDGLGVTQAQIISTLLIVIGGFLIFWLPKYYAKKSLPS